MGITYETQYPITGLPDFFIPPNIAVFCDGCFFHGHDKCYAHRRRRNIDLKVDKRLKEKGYIVLRFWECEINHDIKGVMKKIMEAIEK